MNCTSNEKEERGKEVADGRRKRRVLSNFQIRERNSVDKGGRKRTCINAQKGTAEKERGAFSTENSDCKGAKEGSTTTGGTNKSV